jgi:hypothetical protein
VNYDIAILGRVGSRDKPEPPCVHGVPATITPIEDPDLDGDMTALGRAWVDGA